MLCVQIKVPLHGTFGTSGSQHHKTCIWDTNVEHSLGTVPLTSHTKIKLAKFGFRIGRCCFTLTAARTHQELPVILPLRTATALFWTYHKLVTATWDNTSNSRLYNMLQHLQHKYLIQCPPHAITNTSNMPSSPSSDCQCKLKLKKDCGARFIASFPTVKGNLPSVCMNHWQWWKVNNTLPSIDDPTGHFLGCDTCGFAQRMHPLVTQKITKLVSSGITDIGEV